MIVWQVLSLLQKVGITKVDEVTVVPDPENTELNRGFAFIEFETKSDAQMAYRKLQIKNVFWEYSKIKVAWAESLADPVEEEIRNVCDYSPLALFIYILSYLVIKFLMGVCVSNRFFYA